MEGLVMEGFAMNAAPKRIGLIAGIFGWRLWNRDEDEHTPASVEYILASNHDAEVAEKDAEIARLREALSKSVAAANLRDTYNKLPPDRNRIGDKKSPKSHARDIWMRALRRAEVSARAALKGDDNG